MTRSIISLVFILTTFFSFTVHAASELSSEQLAMGCFSCHGVDGASQGPAIPVIAGLSKNYLIGAMLSYKYADNLDKAGEIIDTDKELEDVRVKKRFASMMERIAKSYNLEEIKAIAAYFSQKTFVRPQQEFDRAMAESGKKLHKKYCEKCHEEEGRSTEDDVGLLAGQWKEYLTYTLDDFAKGDREMLKKMKDKMESLLESKGPDGIKELIEYYSSQK